MVWCGIKQSRHRVLLLYRDKPNPSILIRRNYRIEYRTDKTNPDRVTVAAFAFLFSFSTVAQWAQGGVAKWGLLGLPGVM